MDQDAANELRKALGLLQAGEVQEARTILVDLLRSDPTLEQAWFMLSFTLADPERQIYALEQALRINPSNERTRRRLEKLQQPAEEPPPSGEREPAAAPEVLPPFTTPPPSDLGDLEVSLQVQDEAQVVEEQAVEAEEEPEPEEEPGGGRGLLGERMETGVGEAEVEGEVPEMRGIKRARRRLSIAGCVRPLIYSLLAIALLGTGYLVYLNREVLMSRFSVVIAPILATDLPTETPPPPSVTPTQREGLRQLPPTWTPTPTTRPSETPTPGPSPSPPTETPTIEPFTLTPVPP